MSATITQSTRSATQIAEDAFIYGFPLIMNYGIMYEYAVNPKSGQYKAPFNQIFNEANVFTPKDTAVITPNSDTPYSMLFMDLRAEPVVLSVPEVETGRYYTVQIVDLYTHNYAYVGSRATGNEAASFMVAGPGWSGPTPPGIKKVFQCETLFSAAAFRTQLFGPADIDNVRKIQAGYKVQTLSQFLGQPAPPASRPIDFPPITKDLAKADPFAFVNFMLSLCPSQAVETALRAEFATIGVEAGKPFNFTKLAPGLAGEVVQGIKSGMAKIEQKSVTLGTPVNGWRTGLNSGSRAYYKGDWLLRAGVALAGIYANDAAEALYPVTHTDSTGGPLDGSTGKYTLTFPAGQPPPVNAFWSLTMYDSKTQLLVDNPINRYLLNSPMLPGFTKNADGSLTLYIQKDSPGTGKEANWLPAPNGAFYMLLRLYWPKQDALDGRWKAPGVEKTS